MDNKEANELVKRFKAGECTAAEEQMLRHWLHHNNEAGPSGLSEGELFSAQDEMWQAVRPVKKPIKRKLLQSIAAAAAILAIVTAGLLFYNQKEISPIISTQQARTIKPGGNNAILTLANGKKIILNDVANGDIAEQSGIKISKTADGQLVYSVTDVTSAGGNSASIYNTIETPKGGQYQINLPDGSKVWLNALSSLRFPARFMGKSRKVELTGEGYFEIAHNKEMPFKVKTTNQEVEVLGTHFNINSYADEATTMTTLLEGSVRINSSIGPAAILKPGQQSVLTKTNIKIEEADAEAAIAWKNGDFRFNDEKLESIMRKVSRWYNVEVKYQNDSLKTEPFGGVITRFAKVSELLKMLELTKEVKFKVEGNTIVVMDGK